MLYHDKLFDTCPQSTGHSYCLSLCNADRCQATGIHKPALLYLIVLFTYIAIPKSLQPASSSRHISVLEYYICGYCKTGQIQIQASGEDAVTHQYLILYYSCLRWSLAWLFSCLFGCMAPCICVCLHMCVVQRESNLSCETQIRPFFLFWFISGPL